MTESSEQSSQPRWSLVLYDDSTPVQSFPVTGETFTIGRELFNDLPLEDLCRRPGQVHRIAGACPAYHKIAAP